MKLIGRQDLRAPARVVEIELAGNGSSDRRLNVTGLATLWCLYRNDGLPHSIAFWDVDGEEMVTVPDPVETVDTAERYRDGSGEPPADLRLTVVICTRERPDGLSRALDSLRRQTDQAFSILVVDNAPLSEATRTVVDNADGLECRYVVEPRPGLSRARNRGLAEVTGDVAAWLDDDEVADPGWIDWLKRGFGHSAQPVAVCGLMLPAELATEAQARFEQYGGFNKGRTLEPEVLAVSSGTVRSPLYPLPGFGSGGNMAFRITAAKELGGFDAHLGAGTRTHGGEETNSWLGS